MTTIVLGAVLAGSILLCIVQLSTATPAVPSDDDEIWPWE